MKSRPNTESRAHTKTKTHSKLTRVKAPSRTLRTITVIAVIVIITVGFITNYGIGTLSAIGWQDIALLCPLGALGTMLASKMLVPKALISLAIAAVAIIIFARAFCAWACPVPLVSKLRNIFSKGTSKKELEAKLTPNYQLKEAETNAQPLAELTEAEKAALSGCARQDDTGSAGCASDPQGAGCSSCAERRGKVDSRHFILGGSLLSAAIFGFPVFCLVCPIGLSFATILLFIRLFANGDVTWTLIAVPLLLIVEVVLFKKWCGKLCPLAALMSIVGKLNRTFKPRIKDSTCIESAKGRECGVCAKVCPEGIDPRHPKLGEAWSECTKCRECVDACPTKSITMPLLPKKPR